MAAAVSAVLQWAWVCSKHAGAKHLKLLSRPLHAQCVLKDLYCCRNCWMKWRATKGMKREGGVVTQRNLHIEGRDLDLSVLLPVSLFLSPTRCSDFHRQKTKEDTTNNKTMVLTLKWRNVDLSSIIMVKFQTPPLWWLSSVHIYIWMNHLGSSRPL